MPRLRSANGEVSVPTMCARISRKHVPATEAFGLSSAVAQAQEPPTADLAIVSNTANVRHARVGDQVIFTVVGTDNGPDVTDEFYVITAQAEQGFIDGPPLCDRFGDCAPVICDRIGAGQCPER